MQDYRVKQAQIYTDFSGLNAMKTQARTDKQAALEQVAKQFESLFLAEMLKSMRKAGDVFAEGNYLNSNESEFYRDMFDSQVSLSMANGSGTGLAEALVRQLSRDVPGMDNQGGRLAGHKASLADYDRSMPAISRDLPERIQAVEQVAQSAGRDKPENVSAPGDLPLVFESPEHFVSELMPFAQRIGQESGIDPRLMVAQAALETGWGRHMIKGEGDQPSFNLFGIKADTRWGGEAVSITTTEFRGGVPMRERADFRAYPDYEASFRDYVDFLNNNPRYKDVLASADEPEVFADKLQEAGYATDPEYGSKIRRIMNRDSLMTLSQNSDRPRE
ncbi:flagellar assembly peptidoglycan hydrolase FlgJ [Marinobacter sp.]|uniref:flagellar assembly peptidoglycan hydrolase FlgJ n=1 Tax=Marinobacter sp. TaxID=50741 RepID=UPI0019D984A9|nr:flagellar assembly peptidoglycan hydrolase FlgJ [Marinobacter sp.]MBE0485088.1 flagellar assembly peptidoglycan hydrolase FlgJ [Marinobacter sp.]